MRNATAFTIRSLRRIVLPGFDGLPLFSVLQFFFKGLFEGRLTLRASAISFDFFLALFPSILFFFTIIPFVPIAGFQPELLLTMEDVIPSTLWTHVSSTLEDIITRPRSDLLSLGFILALVFSTNGINSIIEGFNSTYHSMESRSWLKQRLVALFLVFVISFLIILAVSLQVVGSFVMKFLVAEGLLTNNFTIIIIQIVRWFLVIATFLFTISFLYYFAPARKGSFRFISAGSTFATLLMILTTYGFNFYIENFNRYNALYGSIGTLLVFLLWVYFNSNILLIGFELNASIRQARSDLETQE
jgi:membrane protein